MTKSKAKPDWQDALERLKASPEWEELRLCPAQHALDRLVELLK